MRKLIMNNNDKNLFVKILYQKAELLQKPFKVNQVKILMKH